jgi:hypothetical protein
MNAKLVGFTIMVTALMLGNMEGVLCNRNDVRAVSDGTSLILPSDHDSYVSVNNPDTNYGSSTRMWAASTVEGAVGEASYIRFDISAIPTGAIILSATLKLLCTSNSAPGLVYVYRVMETWNEYTITWNSGASWYHSQSPPSVFVDATGWYAWDVTQNVTKLYLGEHPNYGFALVRDETGLFTTKFVTKEYGCPSCRPKLEIIYTFSTPELTAIRTINPDAVLQGHSFTVEVDLTAHDDVAEPALDENIPAGWPITPIDNPAFMFNASRYEWTFIGNWSSGSVTTIVYAVDVPPNADPTTYSFDGQVSGFNCGPYAVGGDLFVTVLPDWNVWDNDGIITTVELQDIINHWINNIPKLGHFITTTELQYSVTLWLLL